MGELAVLGVLSATRPEGVLGGSFISQEHIAGFYFGKVESTLALGGLGGIAGEVIPGHLHGLHDCLLDIGEEAEDAFNATVFNAQPIENLHLYVDNQILDFLIELRVAPLDEGDDEVDDLGSLLGLEELLVFVRLLVLEGGVQHRQADLDQFHCLNNMWRTY